MTRGRKAPAAAAGTSPNPAGRQVIDADEVVVERRGETSSQRRSGTTVAALARAMADSIKEGIAEAIKVARGLPAGVEDPLQAGVRERARIATAAGVPSPLNLGNHQVLKEPWLWLLFLSSSNAVKSHIRGEFGTPGAILLAVDVATGRAYPKSNEAERAQLNAFFSQVAMIFLNHPASAGVEDLLTTVEPTMTAASALIIRLDEREIASTIGGQAANAYVRTRTGLDAGLFSVAAAEALRSASKVCEGGKRGGTDQGGPPRKAARKDGKEADRVCKKCGKEVPVGTLFKDHRKTCK